MYKIQRFFTLNIIIEKITFTQEGFYFNNTYNIIKEFFRVEYKKSINAEIIQPF